MHEEEGSGWNGKVDVQKNEAVGTSRGQMVEEKEDVKGIRKQTTPLYSVS